MLVDARVGYHDARQRVTISVVTEAIVARPRVVGVIQEGLLSKREVIHHSCALRQRSIGSATKYFSPLPAKDK